jgi:probable F420-dependent oxidoreductase
MTPAHNRPVRLGVQIAPQHAGYEKIRETAAELEDLGVDILFNWDHFYPLYGNPDGLHFESWTMLAAWAEQTSTIQFGALVNCNSYRNPDLQADMARTIDHISHGRFILGIGSGWFERDYDEYGYEFGTAPDRLRRLEQSLPVIMERLGRLHPPPIGDLPILIGGSGEKVTLRLVAQYADGWNSFGPPERFAEKNRVLNEWCARLDRNPAQIERTVGINANEVENSQAYLDAGATHLIVMTGPPYDLDPVRRLLEIARS